MNELLKRKIERSCGTKVKFLDEKEAMRAAREMESVVGYPMTQYQCRYCGFWHVARDKELGGN